MLHRRLQAARIPGRLWNHTESREPKRLRGWGGGQACSVPQGHLAAAARRRIRAGFG